MYIWNFIYAIFVYILRTKGFTIGKDINLYNLIISPLINGHQFAYNMGTWFVVPLFMVEVFNIILRKIIKLIRNDKSINEYVISIFYLVLGMIGVYIAYRGFNTGGWLVLTRFLYFLPFYGIGILYNRKLEKVDKLDNIKYFIVVFTIQLVIITIFGKKIAYTPSWCNDFSKNVILPYIVGMLGIAFWLRIAKILSPITKNSKTINIIADSTYSIMVHQFLGFFIVKILFAIVNKFTPLINNFNWVQFKTNIWYYYLPKGLEQWCIIYLIAGIAIPILIDFILKKVKTFYNKIIIKNYE